MTSDEWQDQPPAPIGPAPLMPRQIVDLFLRPRRFFTENVALGRTPYAVLVAWCYGAATAIDRLDQNLLRAEFGRPRPGWDRLAPFIVDWWPGFWLYVLVSGALGGLLLWWLGGWWFWLRVRWSGAEAPDRRMARLVMAYSAFIYAAPAVGAAAISMLFFASYAEAFDSEELYSLVFLILPFWSVAASYTGVRAVFGVSGWKPRLWFLILPSLAYVVVLGLIAALLALL